MQETKFCKDCKYHKHRNTKVSVFDVWQKVHICMHGSSENVYKQDNYLVDAGVTKTYNACNYMRLTKCKNAVLFEPKVSMLSKVINLFKKRNIE